MSLQVTIDPIQDNTIRIALAGRLDTETAAQFDGETESAVGHDGMVVVLDLAALDYISSAGLRSVFKMKKWVKATDGHFAILNPTPQVKKVFEIVKAVPVKSIFNTMAELDEYLDAVQAKVLRGEE
jgi:anti-anti-sigma factor